MSFSSTNHTAALTSLPIFNFPGTSGSLLAFSGYRYRCFSAFNYAATFGCGRIPCPGLSGGRSDRNNHLWVIFQQRAEGSGRRSVTNKMDSIKNQFHSCYRNEQRKEKKKKKKAIQQLSAGGGLEGRKATCLREIFPLLWYKEM